MPYWKFLEVLKTVYGIGGNPGARVIEAGDTGVTVVLLCSMWK